jgi:hypothetical protein
MSLFTSLFYWLKMIPLWAVEIVHELQLLGFNVIVQSFESAHEEYLFCVERFAAAREFYSIVGSVWNPAHQGRLPFLWAVDDIDARIGGKERRKHWHVYLLAVPDIVNNNHVLIVRSFWCLF